MSWRNNAEATQASQKRQKLVSLQVTDLNLEADRSYEEVADSNSMHEWHTDQDIFNQFLDLEYSLQDQQNFTPGIDASSSPSVGQSFVDGPSFDIVEVSTPV